MFSIKFAQRMTLNQRLRHLVEHYISREFYFTYCPRFLQASYTAAHGGYRRNDGAQKET
jgi:hypothetical protein